jgi:hypothetical protein
MFSSIRLCLVALVLAPLSNVAAFSPLPQQTRRTTSALQVSAAPSNRKDELFPVLRKIQGIDWEGECRYTGADLNPAPFLLKGGSRYDLDMEADNTCTLTSFLTFPNGQTRRVSMSGKRGSLDRPSMRLDPVEEEGPIYMVLTELAPDTVLLNEVDKESGKIILTASISLVNGGTELVQVSHEVGDKDTPIEGHQVWRLKKATIVYDDFGNDEKNKNLYRDATGR